jgi:transcriptional regulator with XRE-family HTH domain
MSKKKKEKVVYVDLLSLTANLTVKEHKKVNVGDVAEKFEMSRQALDLWKKEAPKSIRVLFKLMKEYDIPFDELVKERDKE